MSLQKRFITLFVTAAFSAGAAADYDRLISANLGGLKLDDQKGDAIDGAGEPLDIEFPTLPIGGIEGEYRYGGERLAWGINPGGSVAWKSSGTRVAGSIGGSNGAVIVIDVDNAFFFGELHLGGYVRGRLGESVTAYAAAGPMVTYGKVSVEDEDIQGADDTSEFSDSSDFGFGYYARAGIDLEIKGEQSVGLGIRYISTSLEFDDGIGDVDIEGPSVFLSYTVPL